MNESAKGEERRRGQRRKQPVGCFFDRENLPRPQDSGLRGTLSDRRQSQPSPGAAPTLTPWAKNVAWVLQQMYDSEINFTISVFWDAGFDWKLGDELNGYVADGCAKTMEDCVVQLGRAAIEHFPDSVFAKVVTQ